MYTIFLYFRFPQPLVIDITSQYSVLTAVQTTYGTYGQAGSSHRVLGRAVFSLYSARLQYNLTVLAPATLPAWPFLGILRSLASA